MNSIDVEVLRSAIDWQARGHAVTLGTVVRTWGSAPRPPGSLMVIRDDGLVLTIDFVGAAEYDGTNFCTARYEAAVTETAGRAQLEASGSVSLENVRAIAQTGVDFISVGGITKNIQAIDLSMRFSEIRSFS